MKKRKSDPVLLAEALREKFRSLGWDRKIKEQDILSRWEEAVGPQISLRARPLFVKKRRLTVVVDSPAWAQQLALLKKDLLKRFDALLGEGTIDDLYFTSGLVEPAAEKSPSSRPPDLPPDPEVKQAINEEASHIAEGDLREAFRKYLLAANRRRRNPQ